MTTEELLDRLHTTEHEHAAEHFAELLESDGPAPVRAVLAAWMVAR